jgi:hypothetical protein
VSGEAGSGTRIGGPTRGEEAWLTVGSRTGELSTCVLANDGTYLDIAGPRVDGEPLAVNIGADVVLSWITPRGPAQLPAMVIGVEVTEDRPMWRLQRTGDPEIVQRRRFVRAGSNRSIDLQLSAERTAPATLVELSEGGMSCYVFVGVVVRVGTIVSSVLELDGAEVPVLARVVRDVAASHGRRRLSFAFVALDPHDADRIRGHVFTQQVRRRTEEVT